MQVFPHLKSQLTHFGQGLEGEASPWKCEACRSVAPMKHVDCIFVHGASHGDEVAQTDPHGVHRQAAQRNDQRRNRTG